MICRFWIHFFLSHPSSEVIINAQEVDILLVVDGLGEGVQGGAAELSHLLLAEGLALLREQQGELPLVRWQVMLASDWSDCCTLGCDWSPGPAPGGPCSRCRGCGRRPAGPRARRGGTSAAGWSWTLNTIELQTKVHEDFTEPEKAPTRAPEGASSVIRDCEIFALRTPGLINYPAEGLLLNHAQLHIVMPGDITGQCNKIT